MRKTFQFLAISVCEIPSLKSLSIYENIKNLLITDMPVQFPTRTYGLQYAILIKGVKKFNLQTFKKGTRLKIHVIAVQLDRSAVIIPTEPKTRQLMNIKKINSRIDCNLYGHMTTLRCGNSLECTCFNMFSIWYGHAIGHGVGFAQ